MAGLLGKGGILAAVPRPGRMAGFKPYQIWGEKEFGQNTPTKIDVAESFPDAKKKAQAMKAEFPYVYIIRIAAVWEEHS